MTKSEIYKAAETAKQALRSGLTSGHYAQAAQDGYSIISDLLANLIGDVRSEANKASGQAKVEKIVKDILKAAEKNYKSWNKEYNMMTYTSIIDGKQYCLDGHRLFELYTPIVAPVWEKDNPDGENCKKPYYDCQRMFGENTAKVENIPELETLRSFNKVNKKLKPVCVMTVNGLNIMVNALWLQNGLDNLTEVKIYSQGGTWKSPIILNAKEGRLLILPINNESLQDLQPGLYCLNDDSIRKALEARKAIEEVA